MIKQFFKDTPRSVFFWNGLVLLAFIILCFMGQVVVFGTMFLISIPALFLILINFEDSRYDDSKKIIGYHYWVYLSPVTWILIAAGFILGGLFWVGFKIAQAVRKFNKYLNKK